MHTLTYVRKLGAYREVKTEMKRVARRKMGLSGKECNLLMGYELGREMIQSQHVVKDGTPVRKPAGRETLKLETGIVQGKILKWSHFLGKIRI